jgi:hypothetical protein
MMPFLHVCWLLEQLLSLCVPPLLHGPFAHVQQRLNGRDTLVVVPNSVEAPSQA